MMRSLRQLHGVALDAIDGEIGSVYDIYFDDGSWNLRYYVIDTGRWLPGRKVLVPPAAVEASADGLSVRMTMKEIEGSPDIDSDRPVSRQAEAGIEGFDNSAYWLPDFAAASAVAALGSAEEREESAKQGRLGGDPHLRSFEAVRGSHVEAVDGEIGHVDDFIVDDRRRCVRYVVVKTRNWLPGRSVMIPPAWIREIRWATDKVLLTHSRADVQHQPEYRHDVPFESDFDRAF